MLWGPVQKNFLLFPHLNKGNELCFLELFISIIMQISWCLSVPEFIAFTDCWDLLASDSAKVLRSGWNRLHASVNGVCHIYRDLWLADLGIAITLFPCCLPEWNQKHNGNNEGSRSFYTSNLQSIIDWNDSEGSFLTASMMQTERSKHCFASVTILFLCLLSSLQILAGWWWNDLEWN